jgi:ABC-type dipeptide/oligopeptide/nickel transport system permease component
MARYLIGRLAGLVFVLLTVSFLTFFLMYNTPGGPYEELNQPMSAEAKANMLKKYGLDQPFYVNWWNWMQNAVRGDFGESYYYPGTPVVELFTKYWGSSLLLGFLALAWSFPVGVILGIVAALKRNTIIDQILTTLSLVTITLPLIAIIFFGIAIFVVGLKWFTFTDGKAFYEQPVSAMILPVFLFGVGTVGSLTRYTRSGMLDVLGQDYIRTAKAKGVSRKLVIMKHAMRNMLIPIVTIFAPVVFNVVTGSIYVEIAFGIPGVGRYFLTSIFTRDYPVIIFTVIITALVLTVSNLIVDISYTLIDPRVRLSGGSK